MSYNFGPKPNNKIEHLYGLTSNPDATMFFKQLAWMTEARAKYENRRNRPEKWKKLRGEIVYRGERNV